jgi:transposase
LQQDEGAPPKQRHTAMRIFERLRDEQGYQGGYDAVRRFVKKHRQKQRETFIPLAHDAGQRMEADFGEIAVDFPTGRCKVSVLILSWSYSNAAFAMALPTQRTEAILAGMCEGFDFFGCVPLEVWWDNPTTVATAILTGRERKLNERYAALASHFTFDSLFCMPASGNEKPSVENRVKTLQRRWSTPVPRVEDMNELNAYLRQRCQEEMSRTCQGKSATIGERFQAEKAAAQALPSRPFEACVRAEAKVDKYQFARFDNVCYSVPCRCAFQTVTVKGFVDRVQIVHQNTVVATHVRSYTSGDQVLDPRHYLSTLQQRPAALDHSNVYRNWQLPAVFFQLRERLEEKHGNRQGKRQFVRVLQLLASHPLVRVQSAIEQLRGPEGANADRIIRRVEEAAARASSCHDHSETCSNSSLQEEGISANVLSVQVPMPDLSHFNQFLCSFPPGGDDDAQARETSHIEYKCQDIDDASSMRRGPDEFHVECLAERRPDDAVEVEPETVAVADDEVGVRVVSPGSSGSQRDVPGVPAASDGTGSGGPCEQCLEFADQASLLPATERLGQLRLLGVSLGQQTEGVGAWALRLDFETLERVPVGPTGHRQDTSGCRVGPVSMPRWNADEICHRGCAGEPAGSSPAAIQFGPTVEAFGQTGSVDRG